MNMNRALAVKLAALVESEKKQCFHNSVMALLCCKGELGSNAVYVEGVLYLAEFGLVIEHGWLEVNGALVDVTIMDAEAQHYYPLWRYPLALVQVQISLKRGVPYFKYERGAFSKIGRAQFDVYREWERVGERMITEDEPE